MTAPQLQAAGIKKLFLSDKNVRTLDIHWDLQDPSNNHLRETDSLCDEWDDIEQFLDDEEGIIFLDRKCEVLLTNTAVELVEKARDSIGNENADRLPFVVLKLLGQEVEE